MRSHWLVFFPVAIFALLPQRVEAVEVPPNPYYNAPQNLTIESAPNSGITVKWDVPEVSNYDRIDIYVIEFYRLTDGVESGGWAVWTDSENHAYTFGSWIFNYTGDNLRFKIKAGSDACVGRPDPVGYCLYGTKASVDANATNLAEPTIQETTTTWESTTSSTTSTTTSTTTVPQTTVPVTNPTTTTVQETMSSVQPTTTTIQTTTTQPSTTSTLLQITIPVSVETSVPTTIPETTTSTSTPVATATTTPTTLPLNTTTSTQPKTSSTTPLVPSSMAGTYIPSTTFSSLLEAPSTSFFMPESPKTPISPQQALVIAVSAEALQTISNAVAEQVFESLDVAELSNEEITELVVAVQSAPQEVRQAFESKVNMFDEGFDDYVPVDSNIPVSERRTLIAVGAGISLVSASPTRVRKQ